MKYIFLLLASLAVYFPAFSQSNSGVIKGAVSDSVKVAALSFVTVSLRETGQTTFLKSTYTDEKGTFQFTGLAFKPYEVVISYVGFKPVIIKTENLSAGNALVNLPAIKLQPDARQLKEVEITTQKMLITQDIDKISYDVEADPESKTETVLDMLRKVPMVTVDGDDNIQLKGSSSYRVLINGKTSALFVQNPKDVLKSMPASSIKKIEVLTNPPAKYEAEGVGGIINIITNKDNPGGYNGSVTAGLRTPTGYNGGAYLTVKTGKFGFSGNVGANTWQSPENSSLFVRRETNGRNLTQNGIGKNNGNYHYGSGQLSFELDSLNLFTGSFSFFGGGNDIEASLNVLSDSLSIPVQQYLRSNTQEESWKGNDISLDYQRSFRKNEEQVFTLSYKYSTNGNGDFSDFNFVPLLNYEAQTGKTSNDSKESEHTVQADYVQPFGENTWEVGLKTISRLNQSSYFYALQDPDNGVFVPDPAQSNDFDYRQDVLAGYTSVSLKVKDWGLRAGARLEETRVDATFKTSDTAARQDYFNLIPSVAVSRKLKEMQDLKLSYTQRLERPGLWFLNPYINRLDPKNISFGNPGLEATTSHAFELAHSAFVKNSSLNSSLFYNFTNNAIQEVTTLRGDTSITTYANIGKEQNVGISLNGNLNLTKKLNLNLNTSLNYVFLKGALNGKTVSNEGFAGSAFGSTGYKFEKNWKLNASGGFSSRWVQLQGRSGGYFHSNLMVTKTFLKNDKATISLSVNNPFQKTRRWINEVNDPRFYQRQESEFIIRRVGLAFTYKFGELKGGIAQKKRGIENDDVKGGKSGGGN
ncbi:TonB-dependent receptor [Adhaeribacter sp. BT258]|uniref:TonB-dependent receptor n=1 Tax=Adhaeribacter terrigena TaxID=2793070 RepID=A0ABS1C4E7_9BACT|nr:outer membrane beta-barrel family protein [Adhaeribacter terrigena]MBK0404234.1 TonB-dependent receptor [Adhaeribacter terrigena]